MKLYAEDSSLFARISGVDSTHNQIETDLETIAVWANQWEVLFNPDITKQAVEMIFSVKMFFIGISVARENFTKHLGANLDERLSFAKHIREAIIKAKKGIALLKFISKHVSSNVLNMAYKLYIRPHYGDVIFHN